MPLPWFRRKKAEDTAPLTRAPEAPEVEPLTVDEPATIAADDGQSSTTAAQRKRRRGTRGGRNRKKSTAASGGATAATATEDAPPAAKEPRERKTPERKTRTAQSRRRTPPRRAPLPKAKRELLISVDAGEKRVAVLEDDKVAEVYLERPERRSIAGNI